MGLELVSGVSGTNCLIRETCVRQHSPKRLLLLARDGRRRRRASHRRSQSETEHARVHSRRGIMPSPCVDGCRASRGLR